MYCSKCGKPLPDDAKFCPDCGTKTNSNLEINLSGKKSGGFIGKLLLFAVVCVAIVGIVMVMTNRNNSASENVPTSTPVEKLIVSDSSETVQQDLEKGNPLKDGDVSQGLNQSDVSQGLEQMDRPEETGQGTWEEDLMPQSLEYLTAVIWDDFIYPERLLAQGLPSNAEKIELYNAGGAWKYELFYPEANYKEIGAATLMFGQNGVEWDFYPTQSLWGNELHNTSREEVGYEQFTGAIEEEVYSLRGNDSTLLLGPFVRIEGTEFGFGSLAVDGGMTGNILLTRP